METRNDATLETMLKETQALMEGHFVLSSGLHSNRYVQCAKLTQYPQHTAYVAKKLADFYRNEKIDVVIGGAFGGIVMSYALARELGVRSIFAERVSGVFALRRGFAINPGEKVLIAEDVCTTGKSIREVNELIDHENGITIGCACIIDRMEERGQDLNMRKEWLHSVHAQTWAEDALPDEIAHIPITKPGSRFQK